MASTDFDDDDDDEEDDDELTDGNDSTCITLYDCWALGSLF